MKPAFTFDEIREIEKNIIHQEHVPSIILMENAGKNSCDVLLKRFKDISDYEIYIICGKGNNAGDGYTLARHMVIKGYYIKIVQLVDSADLKGDALINYDLLTKISAESDNCEIIHSYELEFFRNKSLTKNRILFIDAILGTGIKGSLDQKFSGSINIINNLKILNRKIRVVSLDVPSGLISGEHVNPVIDADITISMGTYKTELLFDEGKENSGELHVVPIGIDESLISKYDSYGKKIVEQADVMNLFPKRRKTSYKYSNGKVLIIGGSRGLSGAVVMSSISALKSGAGAVVAAIPASISPIFNKKLYEIMTLELDETAESSIAPNQFDKLKKRMEWADAVLIGPGLSLNEHTKEFLYEVITKCEKNLVIDADALTLISTYMNVLLNRNAMNEVILTPHLGEFSKMSGIEIKRIKENRFEVLKEFIGVLNVNVSLKSETTVSAVRTGEFYINSAGNQSLATIGSGDVLSGIMVSLLAQTNDTKRAMICGNYLHGMCSELYSKKFGNKQTASPKDMIGFIPKAVTDLLQK
jgi:hydroxyethylthiazole kinase-like uncharacterized protein yjeF